MSEVSRDGNLHMLFTVLYLKYFLNRIFYVAFDLVVVTVSSCRFVMKYSELESRGEVKPELLFEETAKALLTEGIYLRKRGGPAVRKS